MNQSTKDNGAQSITPDKAVTQSADVRKGTGVAASPFNEVKLDLGLVLVGAVALLLSDWLSDWPGSWGLAGYGMLCSFWLVWRTRRVVKKSHGEPD